LLILALVLAIPVSTADARTKPFNFPGGWPGNIFFDDATGEFTHCAASDIYKNGTSLIVSIDRTYNWTLGFVNDAWRLTPNSKTTIFIKIDNALWKSYTAVANSPDTLFVFMPPGEQEMINLFRFGRVMNIKFDTWDYWFELSGTSKLLLSLAACVNDNLSPPKVAQAPSEKPKPKKKADPESTTSSNVEKQKPEKAGSSTGTGIIVNETGLILTNNHVAEDCKTIKFSRETELTQEASLLRADRTNDLALLKPVRTFQARNFAKFRTSPPVKAGEEVAVYGFPLAGMLSVSGNVVSGNISSLAGIGDDVRFYQTSAPVQPGNSGGPLLDYAGTVIGIVTARIDDFLVAGATGSFPQNVNFAVKAQIATSFMDTHGVEYQTAAKTQDKNLSAVVDTAKQFTVMIECER
jgi:S1-C subfamily serine protease